MATNQGQGLQYSYICALSEEEKQVQAMGYPWVTTNHLDRRGVLGRHSHRSPNTHLIIRGSLTISTLRNRADACTYHAGEHADQTPHTLYEGQGGRNEGCSFVEGHQVLSPTTRDRIERNDVAKAIRNNVNIGENSRVRGSAGDGGDTKNVIRVCHCDSWLDSWRCSFVGDRCLARTGNN